MCPTHRNTHAHVHTDRVWQTEPVCDGRYYRLIKSVWSGVSLGQTLSVFVCVCVCLYSPPPSPSPPPPWAVFLLLIPWSTVSLLLLYTTRTGPTLQLQFGMIWISNHNWIQQHNNCLTLDNIRKTGKYVKSITKVQYISVPYVKPQGEWAGMTHRQIHTVLQNINVLATAKHIETCSKIQEQHSSHICDIISWNMIIIWSCWAVCQI